ncbi:uncharacterized protein PRCAT00002804001 [Priceomyces carsonii]|uniref:uncharacterized protein n=1 Tax=Priceomyces carsonii TaxID=28549 RepID=UPI002ED8FB6C|nr:unnamed protein product [Priceomyces carsonii]
MDLSITNIRRNSEETLVQELPENTEGYDVDTFNRAEDISQDLRSRRDDDILSFISDTATTMMGGDLFNHLAESYRFIRRLSVVCSFLHPDATVLNNGRPLLQTSTSVLSVFKKNSLFMDIHKVQADNQKTEFCKAYFRVLSNNLSCYILYLNLSEGLKTLVIMNNGIKPSNDFIWMDTKCRVTGVTGTTSTFAHGSIKLYVMRPSSPSLVDRIRLDERETLIKNFKIEIDGANELCDAVRRQDKPKVNQVYSEGQTSFNFPFASFQEEKSVKVLSKYVKNGTIRIFEQFSEDISETNLVLICILLVLREQEMNKFKGNKGPLST